MIKTNIMPLQMVMETQYGVDEEKVMMMIQAILLCRNEELRNYYDYDELPQVVRELESNNGAKYYVPADAITVEFMEVVKDFQDVLPCEIYFENRGHAKPDYKDDDSDISDNAIWRLYYEEPHDRRTKISA